LLEAISRGDFLIHGLRNRDLQQLLYPAPVRGKRELRRRSAAISRRLRFLRAHGLIRKVGTTHRYHVTDLGRQILPAVMAARKATLKFLNTKVA
jgi:DNA-binding HxlR family transcriptional regulator